MTAYLWVMLVLWTLAAMSHFHDVLTGKPKRIIFFMIASALAVWTGFMLFGN